MNNSLPSLQLLFAKNMNKAMISQVNRYMCTCIYSHALHVNVDLVDHQRCESGTKFSEFILVVPSELYIHGRLTSVNYVIKK